jgi:hypothetical protein
MKSFLQYSAANGPGTGGSDQLLRKWAAESGKTINELDKIPPKISQIKPFSNSWGSQMVRDFTAKNPNYRKEIEPMIQDFVKSGKWGDVGDYANTGLRHGPREFTPAALENLSARGIDATGHMTPEEYEAALGFVPESALSPQQLRKLKGFATGGRVSMIHPAAAIQPLVRVPGFDRF